MTPPHVARSAFAEGTLDVSIRLQLPGGSLLVQDYLRGTGAASRFFASPPADLDAFRRKLQEVNGRFGAEQRTAAARALRPSSARAAQRLHRFVNEGGAVVTTGQQAGLFTGPLYTIYKALTAVRLAEALEAELGTVVLPVFWVASEDHDWDEVNHAFVLHDDDVRRIDLPFGERLPLAMSERTLEGDLDSTLNALTEAVSGQPFAEQYLALVRGAYRAGVTMGAAFEMVLAELLAPFDVLLANAADPVLKDASAEVLSDALLRAPEHEAVLAARTEALVQAGYNAQVPVLPKATNVFFHGNGVRERLFREKGELVGSETGVRMEMGEAIARLREAPGSFSPNVFLRPVVESAVFPTLAYVGGPGEMAYFAQLTPLFGESGIVPPVVVPRASILLVEPELDERLAELGFGIADLARPRHELVDALARRAMPKEVRAALEALSRSVSGGYRDVIEAAIALDPTLAGALGAIRNDSLSRIGRAERKILRRLRELQGERVRELDRVRARLAPGGQPQERVLNVMSFLAAHGPDLLRAIADAIPSPLEATVS